MYKKQQQTHDYTQRYWGHDYVFHPRKQGLEATMLGWGRGLKQGDYLLLRNGTDFTRYQITSVNYKLDPSDMWEAEVVFAPR